MDWINLAYSRDNWKVYCKHGNGNFYLTMDTAVGSLTHLYGHLLPLLMLLTF